MEMKAAKKKKKKREKLELARRNPKFEKVAVIIAIMLQQNTDLYKEAINIQGQ